MRLDKGVPMLQKFEISGVHTTVDDSLRKYVTKKIGRLDRYLPRHHRDSVHAIVELKETKQGAKQRYTCAATMHLSHGTINVAETTVNIYAAVDIVEAKLKQLICKYKEQHSGGKFSRHLGLRFRRRDVVSEPQPQLES